MTSNYPSKRGIRGRTLLIIAPTTAFLTWGILLLFTRFVPPQSPWSLVFVLFLVGLALTSTFSPLIYLIRMIIFPKARLAPATANHALREATLISICIVFNMVLHLFHSSSILTILASFGIILVIEVLILGQE
jgi:hypothetical protein